MKTAHPELVVGLDGKLRRVLRHWEAVNGALPAEYPLVLLQGWTREVSAELAEGLAGLREAVEERELDLALARGAYKLRKAEVHRVLRLFNCWMRGRWKWTRWFVAMRRVPGRGQSYGYWWSAVGNVLKVWRDIVAAPPDPSVDPLARPLTLGDGTTVEQFAELAQALDEAYWEIIAAEVDLQIGRGNLHVAQREATALLMAYGHGVRARFGQGGELVRSIPQLWPRHKTPKKAVNR